MTEYTINAKQFKAINKLISDFTSDYIMNFNLDGIEVKCVDRCNVSLVQINVPKTCMMGYIPDDIPRIQIDSYELSKILTDEMLSFGNLITMNNDIMKCGIVNRKIPSYTTDINCRQEPRIPNIEMESVSFEIGIKQLYNALSLCGEYARFVYESRKLSIMDDEHSDITLNSIINFTHNDFESKEERISTLITLDNIMPQLKKIKTITDKVTVKFGMDYPVEFKFIDKWSTEYMIMLAPRIEPD